MKRIHQTATALLTGVGLGALAVQAIHAQAKPPGYAIAEVDVANLDAYQKEYVPLVQASIKAAGGRPLAAGQTIIVFEGAAPSRRVTINQFDSLQAVQDWRNSAQYREARVVGDKYAKFRAFAVEGLPQ
jgi:uncharacterized protein (DUF1330 family)